MAPAASVHKANASAKDFPICKNSATGRQGWDIQPTRKSYRQLKADLRARLTKLLRLRLGCGYLAATNHLE